MISIGKVRSADYYLGEVERDDAFGYYASTDRAGHWHGSLAAELGLSGAVDPRDFRATLDGKRPDTGKKLTAFATKAKALDVTLSVPKSISVVWALGDTDMRSAVEHAVDSAEAAVIELMETDAAAVRRGHAGAEVLPADGLAVASFDHRTSRLGDPNLHRHLIVINAGRGPDGRITALDTRQIYRIRYTAESVFQAVLRHELSRSPGLKFEPIDRHGVGEVTGIPERVLAEFSRRRIEIKLEMGRHGVTSGRGARIATMATRPSKKEDPADESLTAGWKRRAKFDLRWIKTDPRAPHLTATDDDLAAVLTEHDSTYDHRAVVRAVGRTARDGASLDMILARTDEYLSGPQAVVIRDGLFTTPEIIALEAAATKVAVDGQGSGIGTVGGDAVCAALKDRPMLSDEQHSLVARATRLGDAVTVVIGQAGAGKTTALDALRDAYQRDGYKMRGAALSARAAAELQSGSGIESRTIHRTLFDLRHGVVRLNDRSVLVVDEAAMVGTRQLAEIIDHTHKARAKLVLVGDPRQLPEINAGGTFSAISRRVRPVLLTENRRQHDPDQKAALTAMRQLDATRALGHLVTAGSLTTGPDTETVRTALVVDWHTAHTDGSHAIMLAANRADVSDLNRRARDLLRHHDQLGDPIWQNGSIDFALGDRVVAHRNRHQLGLLNGHQATVTHADKTGVGIRLDDGSAVHVPNEYINAGHLTHGYAITVHKSQGMTCDETYFLGDDNLYNELAYTALSRGRHANRCYAVNARDDDGRLATDPYADIRRALSRSHAKTAAIDHSAGIEDEGISLP